MLRRVFIIPGVRVRRPRGPLLYKAMFCFELRLSTSCRAADPFELPGLRKFAIRLGWIRKSRLPIVIASLQAPRRPDVAMTMKGFSG